ncbi:MAG: hypothetical protein DRO06_04175 [Thermoproteota archaeon]|nr:MAG: hypothetical protein DRO06_04175 [Candidatus Korarchaeota archaeon]
MRREDAPPLLLSAAFLLGAISLEKLSLLSGLAFATAYLTSVALARRSGWRSAPYVALSGSASGLLWEAVGLRWGIPFGRYRYLLRWPDLLGVPIPVVLAWGAYLLASYYASLGAPRRAKAPLAVSLMVLLDMALDPVMVDRGAWAWEDGPGWFGIPWTNFAGWALTSATALALYRAVGSDPDPPGTAVVPYACAYLPILLFSTERSVLPAASAFSAALALCALLARGARDRNPLSMGGSGVPSSPHRPGWRPSTHFKVAGVRGAACST